jgi:dimethylaniline monooxygenase (N-oxide forming)
MNGTRVRFLHSSVFHTYLTYFLSDASTIHASHLAVCTGLHVIPAVPKIPGIEHVLNPAMAPAPGAPKPEAYHSSDYKLRSQLTGRKIMILGTGETGMDLAYESAKSGAKEVVLCSRAGYVQTLPLIVMAID